MSLTTAREWKTTCRKGEECLRHVPVCCSILAGMTRLHTDVSTSCNQIAGHMGLLLNLLQFSSNAVGHYRSMGPWL